MLHLVWKLVQFLLLSWAIMMVLGAFGQLTHVGEKYAIVSLLVACLTAGLIVALHH